MTKQIILLVHQAAEMYGSDKVLLILAKGLADGSRFTPLVVLPEEGPLLDALREEGIEVHIGEVAKISRAIFGVRGFFSLLAKAGRSVRRLDEIVGGREIAVVHSNTLAVLSGALWARLRRRKHLWHVHEIILSPRIVSKAFPRLVRLLSDRAVSNSTLTERWLLSEQPDLKRKSRVVFNGLPEQEEVAHEAVEQFRRNIAPGNELVISIVGRISRWKGHELLVNAVSLLKKSHPDLEFKVAVVGSPAPGLEHLPDLLKEKIELLGLTSHFIFVPFVADVRPVWLSTDIAVVPSTDPEPFGMVAIEAMAAGIPVVAAAHGGLLDIVIDQETGLLFKPSDAEALSSALAKLALDDVFRKYLGKNGLKRQRDVFSASAFVTGMEEAYQELGQ